MENELRFMRDSCFKGLSKIFTDESLNKSSGKGGFGIFIPERDIQFSSLVYDNLPISTIEMLAIYECITLAIGSGIQKVLITCDSLTDLKELSRNYF